MEVSDGGGSAGEKTTPTQQTMQPAPNMTVAEGGEKSTKRKMKTAFQLDLLEKTYAVASYPSETMRAELSAKIGLSDRQLQMWFCHRRLKDRKASEMAAAAGGSGTGTSPHPEPRKALARMSAPAASRMVAEAPTVRSRYYDAMPMPPQQTLSELRAITFVESQLGERIREDGPILGVVFDPLPPGAFGAPIETTVPQKHPLWPYEGKLHEGHDMKSIKTSSFLAGAEHCLTQSSSGGKKKTKVGSTHVVHSQAIPRAVHEYQFLPEQPSVQSDGYERLPPSHFYDRSVDDTTGNRMPALPPGGIFAHGNDHLTPSYGFHDQAPVVQGSDVPFGAQRTMGIESSFLTADRRICREEDAARIERKRKCEEARIAKEVEAHEKRIRRELEKQDILRRKREEQMRKEMERHDRERRKEEERMLREKQREEERYQRELRREHERREKFLQKENQRAEKLRQKEKLRQEKEAARIKAANERAVARRIAREYMELIEDERLELMELAASSKGLPSIISLDGDTLQNLNIYRDMLKEFPPKTVRLKRPFAVKPWADSDENIGNLLMVWRFLITFADVLALWPFTLDEFVQALHDYDPRLLGEIHIALLKCIIKDIEDVARTPAATLGGNHNAAANPGGGHPQIVEGAYGWGFDIRSWQNHLNPSTWPEILRQFALSAGFGPKLKKRSAERAHLRDENEGHDGEDIISTLRSGMAAENALALMQEKGFSRLRRSRHRLTPGTVKFAAFHVLSLERSQGLTILEVADKIQKSGLRDLTTSKTPEASIAAALSRDSKLFERTAPSTYCVRSPYRKDPADADTILAAAREKIQIFENGFSESEEAEKDTEDADYVERDEESESDGGDDPEVDGINAEENFIRLPNQYELKSTSNCLGNGKQILDGVEVNPHAGVGSLDETYSSFSGEGLKDASISVAVTDNLLDMTSDLPDEEKFEAEDTEIDESNSGESWVQGLTEGEYSDISVEERLNALVSLIGVSIEGNTIRIVLEERLEAANSLKKQMWAEAQLDKRRTKEEQITRIEYSSSVGMKAEPTQANVTDDGHSPFGGDNRGSAINLNYAVNGESLDMEIGSSFNTMATERNMMGQEFPTNPEGAQPQQYGYVAEKSRSQLKLYIGHRAEEVYVYRSLPLGQDRRRNRYWQFVASASRHDPGCGRIFFESRDGFWRLIDSEEAFDSLIAALDTRGTRESHLHSMLQKIESSFKETVRRNKDSNYPETSSCLKKESVEMTSSPEYGISTDSPKSVVCGLTSDASEYSYTFKVELGRNKFEKTTAMKRYQDFQRWLWKESFNLTVLCAMKYGKKRCSELLVTCDVCCESFFPEEKHCPFCHKTFKNCYNLEASFSEHSSRCEERRKMDSRWNICSSDCSLPIRFRMLKAQLAYIEASIPYEALQTFWTDGNRKSWGVKLQSSSSADDLLKRLTLLESVIKRDYLSANFETTNELLSCSTSENTIDDVGVHSETVPVLPWIPITTAAVALRVMDLDASIFYVLDQRVESQNEGSRELMKLPSKYSFVKNNQDYELMETPSRVDYLPEYNWIDPGIRRSHTRGRGGRGRGGRGRGRSGRAQRGGSNATRAEFKEDKLRNALRATRKQTRGKTRGRGRSRGRRTVRPRQMPQRRSLIGKDTNLRSFLSVGSNVVSNRLRESPESLEREEWNDTETLQAYAEDENAVGFSVSDDNGQESGDEYDDQIADYSGGYGSKRGLLIDDETDEDELETDGLGNGNDEADADYANDDADELEDDDIVDDDVDEAADFDRNVDEDDGNASYSSGYSD